MIPPGADKRLPVAFFATSSGAEPVREWLKNLGEADRRAIGQDIATAEYGWPIGMPVCRSLGNGLWEIRSRISGRRTARVIFGVAEGRMVLLHALVKKSRKTPKTDLDLARSRMAEI